jgi:senataxin
MLGICTSSGRGAEGFRIAVHQQRLNATLTAEGPPADSDGVKALFMHPLGPVVSALREWEALNSLDKIPLVREILEGREMTENSDQADCTKLCDETLGSTFSGWMRSKFNPSQQDAIAAAASSEGFTLIKGPPGTGKTTTLTALLNAIHLREFNWYYEQLLGLSRLEEGANIDAAWRRIRAQKPHILVCAPSNIAVDNIVQRIIEEGFMDGNGSNYKPDIVRVGRRTGLDAGIVSLEEKVSQITGKSKSWQRNRLNELEDILKAITLTTFDVMGRLRVMVRAMEEGPLPPYWELRLDEGAKPYYVNHWAQSTQCLRPDAPVEGTEGVGLQQMPEWQALAARLTQSMEDFEKCMDEKKKTRFALDYADYQNPNAGDVRNHLEAAILDTAHIVFTTLNSSGQGCMSHCRKFQVVVVDEAAQSVELSTLIPLRLGSKQCVLVGDPQQLSATVFAQNGSATQFDRSLFQRLEHRGHKVHLLNTQYRMHPKISAFPRAAFYDSKLLDGPNVLQLTYSHSFHKHRVFRPFVFLNLTTGVSSSSSKSLCNPAEARLAVNFFTTLMYTTNNEMAGRVGVITPYSQQLRELSRQFSDTLGASWRDKVEVSTVDGFQGREKDVIIVSLVRAQDKGVGFLADVRRMCVSLTRGKYLLCVIGHETTLRVNPLWQQLMHQAKEANVFISIQNPETDLLSLDDEKKAGSCK